MRSHYQANRAAPQGIAEVVTTALPSPTPETTIQKIALNQLTLPPDGCRKISRHSIQALAARIHATGRLQSLMVVPRENAEFYVVAGERRFAALQLLAGDKRISHTFPVPCRVLEQRSIREGNAVANLISTASCPEPDERRRRFLALRDRCPGLLTGSELAGRQVHK